MYEMLNFEPRGIEPGPQHVIENTCFANYATMALSDVFKNHRGRC